MRRLLAAPVLLLAGSGCAITDRLDLTNQQLATTNAQLHEANQRLGDAQAKLQETNGRLGDVQAKLGETNRRIDVIDQAIMKFPGLRPNPTPPPAAPPTR